MYRSDLVVVIFILAEDMWPTSWYKVPNVSLLYILLSDDLEGRIYNILEYLELQNILLNFCVSPLLSLLNLLTNSACVVSSYVLQSSVDMLLVLLILLSICRSNISFCMVYFNKHNVVLVLMEIVPVFVVEK